MKPEYVTSDPLRKTEVIKKIHEEPIDEIEDNILVSKSEIVVVAAEMKQKIVEEHKEAEINGESAEICGSTE